MGDDTTARSRAPEERDKGHDILFFGLLALSFDKAQFQRVQVRRTVVHLGMILNMPGRLRRSRAS